VQSVRQHATGSTAPSLKDRHKEILKSFPRALGVDDFITRVEIALAGYGFTGDNTIVLGFRMGVGHVGILTGLGIGVLYQVYYPHQPDVYEQKHERAVMNRAQIAMSNLCRDESCMVLEDKIETVFGSCFSTHGLGGVLTCGVIGIKAGLSHSPVVGGKERYVFFSFPHIGIDSNGKVGGISRPNRPGASSACGALIACLGDLKKDGLDKSLKSPGVHDPLEPEYSILKQRLARRAAFEGLQPADMSLVDITALAERTITTDLEYLIEKAVDPAKANYAVVTGVQIHNWAADLDNPDVPSLEFVSVGKCYVVVNGKKVHLDLRAVPALSPRQLKLLSQAAPADPPGVATTANSASSGMLQELPRDYLLRRLGGVQSHSNVDEGAAPNWSEYVQTTYEESHPNAPRMDGTHPFEAKQAPKAEPKAANTSFFGFGKK